MPDGREYRVIGDRLQLGERERKTISNSSTSSLINRRRQNRLFFPSFSNCAPGLYGGLLWAAAYKRIVKSYRQHSVIYSSDSSAHAATDGHLLINLARAYRLLLAPLWCNQSKSARLLSTKEQGPQRRMVLVVVEGE